MRKNRLCVGKNDLLGEDVAAVDPIEAEKRGQSFRDGD